MTYLPPSELGALGMPVPSCAGLGPTPGCKGGWTDPIDKLPDLARHLPDLAGDLIPSASCRDWQDNAGQNPCPRAPGPGPALAFRDCAREPGW